MKNKKIIDTVEVLVDAAIKIARLITEKETNNENDIESNCK